MALPPKQSPLQLMHVTEPSSVKIVRGRLELKLGQPTALQQIRGHFQKRYKFS